MIDQEMAAPTFWEDSRKAQALVQERAAFGAVVRGLRVLEAALRAIDVAHASSVG